MNLQQPSSQASSHFTLEPIPASVLAEKEARRREAVALLGSCKTGCPVVDADVLLGGFDRASIVGISAEDEELGVQLGLQTLAHSLCEGMITNGLLITPKPAGMMLAGLRDALMRELQMQGCTKDIKTRLREGLDKVMLSCVFDMDGLWEVLADLDRGEPVEEEEGISPHEEKEIQKQDTTEAQVDEIQDSQDDDDEAFSPIRQTSQPPPPEKSPSKLTPHPEVILITHFSSLLTSLFTHRERSAAHAALQLLGSHLRDLSRNLSSSPLILLLNSTSSTFSGPAPIATTATTPPAKQTFIDPTLRSIFNPPSTTGYSSRRTKPNFGLSFTQLLDLHILCTRIPKARNDAEVAVQQRSGEEAKMVWVVEVLLDELGVWEGKMGVRRGREQNWTAVDVVEGRIKYAFEEEEEEEEEIQIPNTSEVRVAAGFGGRRV